MINETQLNKPSPMETSITFYDRIQDPIVAVEKLGTFFAQSGMFGCTKTQQGMVLAMTCLARRIDPLEAAATYHIMDMGGRITVSMKYDAMMAKFRGKGGKQKVIARTPERAEVELAIDGDAQKFAFTWEEAQKEDFVWSNKVDKSGNRLLKNTWATPRGRMQMLWARVVSDGIRTMAPEINFGTYTPEEADIDTATAPSVVQTGNGPQEQKPIDVQTIQPEPEKKTEPVFQAGVGQDGKLTLETMLKLSGGIPTDLQNSATEWLIANGWLKRGENWNTISLQRAQRILNNVCGFCSAIEAWAKQQKTATQEQAANLETVEA